MFLQMFSDRIWSHMQCAIKSTVKWFSFTSVFILRLNNLSFFGFLRNAWTWAATCVYFFFFCRWHVFLICFDTRTVGWIEENAAVHLQRLGDAGKPVGKFKSKFWLWRNSIKAFFSSEEGFKVRTARSSFIIHDPCQLPSVHPLCFVSKAPWCHQY